MTVLRIPAALAVSLLASSALAQESAPAPETGGGASRLLGIRAEVGITSSFGTLVEAEIPSNDDLAPMRATAGTSRGNLRVGYDLPIGVTALLHFGFTSLSVSTTPSDNARAEKAGGGSITTLGLEGRYYFLKTRTVPFAFAEINKTFVSISETSGGDAVQEPLHNLQADAADTFGLAFGAGAEHGFTRQFGVGAKWGLELTFLGYDDRDKNISGSSSTVATAAEIYAAFRF